MKEINSKLEENLVWVHNKDKRIIFYREPSTTSKEQLDFNFQTIYELAKPFEDFYLILDLTKAKRPGPEIRQHILEKFALIQPNLSHLAIYTGKNFILNMAATFIMKKTGLKSYSIHKTLAEAEKKLGKERA